MKNGTYASFYRRITSPFRKNEVLRKVLLSANISLTVLMYILYPVLVLRLLFSRDPRLFRFVMIPGISFLILTAVRGYINAPRPYEKENIDPLIKKQKKGRSLPSRHVFSSFIIAMAWLKISLPAGIILLIVSVLEAAIRVIGGVHYPRDVAAGAAAGILCGLFL